MMPDAMPDAILFHETMKRGGSSAARLQHIQRLLGPRLGGKRFTELGPAHGGQVHSGDVGGGWYLASLDPDDTLNFPTDHDHAKMPRYRWEDQPDGTKHGFLLSPREIELQAIRESTSEAEARKAALAAWKERQEAKAAHLQQWRSLAMLGEKQTPEQRAEFEALDAELFPEAEEF